MTPAAAVWWGASVVAFASCIALGRYVARRPLTPFDLAARALRGAGAPLAIAFTTLGRWYAILALGLAVAASARLLGTAPTPVFALLGSQLLAQGAVGALKRAIHRVRPDFWLVQLERDLSFPSGHAATAIVFFVPLAAAALYGHVVPANVAPAVAGVFALCVVGIPWSRLALGAHYASDVVGGLLFGIGWLCAATALWSMR